MNGSRHELFAGARFAVNEDRRIAGRDLGHASEDSAQRGRRSDNFFEHRCLVDFLPKGDVLLLKPLFGPLTIVDIRGRDKPTLQLSLVVMQWAETREKPTRASIAFEHPQLQFECRGTR